MSTAAKRTVNMVHHPLGDASNPQELDDYLDTIETNVAAKIGGSTGANDNRLVRSDGTGGKTVQATGIGVDDSDNVTGVASIALGSALTAANGGSGRASATAYAVVCGGTTSTAAQQSIASVGTAGQVLTSNGASALPTMQDVPNTGGVTTIVAPTAFGAVASVTITSIPATYAYIVLHIAGVSSDTATRVVLVQVSTDNGSNFDTTAGSYLGYYAQTTPTFTNVGVASLTGGATAAAAATQNISMKLFAYQGGMFPHAAASITGSGVNYTSSVHYIGSTSAVDALKILWNGSGNFDAGTYTLYGIK